MTEAEMFILIGCLLQGALGREWATWMPQSIEALNGSCVLIPCRFDILPKFDNDLTAEAKGLWKKGGTNGEEVFDSSRTGTAAEQNTIKGQLIGQLLKKNCTTILDGFPSSYSDDYFFRLEGSNGFKFTFPNGVKINAQDSPLKPKITTERVEVMEGTSVSLSCSAAAPCPKLPPNLTWTPRLSDSVNQLQENVSVSSVLTFTASHLHHGQNITCRALYTLQQGNIQKMSEASLILRVLYSPKNTSVSVSPSGSVLVGSSMTLTCSSNANPAVKKYTWYKVNGTEMKTVGTGQNLTFTVTESSRSEQYYCDAQNEHGKENSTTVQLNVKYMPQISDSGSCSRTAAEISCSCESRGNPSPSMEWRVSGLRVTNSTERVIREEQLGNTGLRSSLTMRQSQGDTPTLLCVSTNTLGSASLQLHLPSPQQHSGFSITSLLIGAAAAAGAMAITCLIMKAIQKQGNKRVRQCSGSRSKDIKGSPPPPAAEAPVYANHTVATAQHRDPQLGGTDPQIPPRAEGQNRAELEAVHYASIKHSPRPVETQGQDAWDGAAGRGADVVYSQVALKSKNKKGKN
ncbi:myelin-associated glycoprotein-like [Anguilla anguilla]|uniref:myelin-associated glycoprotein-like n=1 Tax=Anguilla anguilla TaxID=7936 RepID=UPI0015B33895|nr:myelin-associated glycoprotein-like [Anguilla anguilla]